MPLLVFSVRCADDAAGWTNFNQLRLSNDDAVSGSWSVIRRTLVFADDIYGSEAGSGSWSYDANTALMTFADSDGWTVMTLNRVPFDFLTRFTQIKYQGRGSFGDNYLNGDDLVWVAGPGVPAPPPPPPSDDPPSPVPPDQSQCPPGMVDNGYSCVFAQGGS
jgi:hypothetical protein